VVKVTAWYNKIRIIATAAPVHPIDLKELAISGDLIGGGSFIGKDAVRIQLW
jgi:hypothetical protein